MSTQAAAKLADDRLVISLDFGTTYSGIAYAFNVPGKKAEVVPILDWPGLGAFRQPKVPTLVVYDPIDPSKFHWGGQIDWRDPAIHGVKLLLDPDQTKPTYLPASSFKKDRKALPKDPVDVAADFIGAMYKHALTVIEGAGISDYFKFCEKDFVLTVPAVWSDKAMDLTLKAAKKAGIHPVTLIKEPEAAALYTLTTHDHAIKPGDAFVVCDAGGGTVDLITYEVKKLEPFMELTEVVPGTGAMAGSLGLNKRFEENVRDVVGDEQFAKLKKSIGWVKALNDFDKNIKTAFDGDVTDVHYVTFPKAGLEDDPAERLSSDCWEMCGDVLQDIFDPIVKDVLRLVESQVSEALYKRGGQGVKGIFLVGGFGASLYLKKLLQERYEPQGIQVIQPHDAWGAIVKGAVLSRVADQATVVATQAVRHYGVRSNSPRNNQDLNQPVVYSLGDNTPRVKKMTWYIKKGENLRRDQPIKFPFYRTLRSDFQPQDLIFQDDLLYSEAPRAPNYPGRSVKTCCTLRADLRDVDYGHLVPKVGDDGNNYFKVSYNLVVSTAKANLRFSLEIGGQEMGSVEASFT